MGLIRFAGDIVGAGLGALGGVADSMAFKEYFVSGDMSNGVLMKRGEKVVTDKSRNTRADDNLISSGSGVDVQVGQCMIIVDNGRVVEFCTEPGRYKYDSSSQPSLLCGENKGLKEVGKEILNQWPTGADVNFEEAVEFHKNLPNTKDPMKAEYFLPFLVQSEIDAGRASVRVLETTAKWYGVTYKEDKPFVVNSIASLKNKGAYPEKLNG